MTTRQHHHPTTTTLLFAGVSILILVASVKQWANSYDTLLLESYGTAENVAQHLHRRSLSLRALDLSVEQRSLTPGAEIIAEEWPPTSIVKRVADEKNRLIIIGINCGFIDMADNYLNSIVKLGVTNYVIVPMDSKTHDVMSAAYPGHVVPVVPELSGVELEEQSSYQSEGFQILTSIRPTFLLHFLEAGYSVFYNDVDMVWRRDAFASLTELNQDKAFLVPGKGGKYGDGACTSTIFMSPTKANINFCKAWQREMSTGKHSNDQFGFNSVLNTKPEGKNLPVNWGDSEKFPTARDYFNSPKWKKEKVYVVHNNQLKLKREKIDRFKLFNLWEPSGRVGEYQCEVSEMKAL